MYSALTKPDMSKAAGFAPSHSTWFAILRAAIQHTSLESVTKPQWIEGLRAAMHSCGIEWVPGRHRQRLTHRRIVRLVGSAVGPEVLKARPGSLKRAALEAAHYQMSDGAVQKRAKRQKIDFHCNVPFRTVPRLIVDGFKKLECIFEKGDSRILNHYQKARNCLEQCLGNPLCDLMLMMVLTISASSVTPHIAPKEHTFSEAPKKKDSALLAANMVTRMLWFLRPTDFPWGNKDDGSILRISEMTKKIGMFYSWKR